MLKTENTIVDIKYQQTGTATAVNPLGMREMQAMAYEHRNKRFCGSGDCPAIPQPYRPQGPDG